MPQVDIETLVSACAGGTDNKIACETVTDIDDDNPGKGDVHNTKPSATAADVPPDFPPESFWLSKDAELDWFDRNAVYERNESTKGMSQSTNTHQGSNSNSNSNSQRFSLNLTSKTSILGLPKTQKASYADAKRRNANARLFPTRTGVIGKPASSVTEPSSPKVSCMGRVRSKRRSRRSSEPGKVNDKPVGGPGTGREKQKAGGCSGFLSMFRSSKPVKNEVGDVRKENPTVEEAPRKSMSASRRQRETHVSVEPVAEPPGLGGMKRFASGRRSTEEFDGVLTAEEAPRKSMSGSRRQRETHVSLEPAHEPLGLGGMKRFASGRRSTEELFDGLVSGSVNLDRRVGTTGAI